MPLDADTESFLAAKRRIRASLIGMSHKLPRRSGPPGGQPSRRPPVPFRQEREHVSLALARTTP